MYFPFFGNCFNILAGIFAFGFQLNAKTICCFIFSVILILKKVLIFFYSLYAYLLAVVLLLFLGPFIFLCNIGGGINAGNRIYKACRIYTKVWFFMAGIYYKEINTIKYASASQYIFIANHTSYLDVFCLLMAIKRPFRALGKKEMTNYPIFGYFYKKAVVTVDRSDITMRAQSFIILKKYIAQKISIFIFPEGTFNETAFPLKSFYDGAFRIAIDSQTPIQPILFLDNKKRMDSNGSFNMTPGNCRIVFLDEVAVSGLSKNDVQQLKQKVFNLMEKGLLENGL